MTEETQPLTEDDVRRIWWEEWAKLNERARDFFEAAKSEREQ